MRVLQVLANRSIGGVTTMLINYNNIIDHDRITFDAFVCDDAAPNILDESILKNKGTVHCAPSIKLSNFKKIKSEFRRVLTEYNYEIIHLHSINTNFLFLKIAKQCGVKKIIIHAHNSKYSEIKWKAIRNYFLAKVGKKYVTHYAACAMQSAVLMFGKKTCQKSNLLIIENPVEANQFSFDPRFREIYRTEYNLTSKVVIGSAARLSKQKNLEFAVDVLRELVKINPDAMLVLIGEGDERAKIEKRLDKFNLKDKALLLGQRLNVNELINMFDCYIMPSKFEGFPVSLVEAQANGLNCFVSQSVSEVVNKGLCEFLPLSIGAKKWSEAIHQKILSQDSVRQQAKEQDLENLANILVEWYIS